MRKNVILVTLNGGRGSNDVVLNQAEAFIRRGYGVYVVSTQPERYVREGITVVGVDVGEMPIPIHDHLPGAQNTKPVFAMTLQEARLYAQLFESTLSNLIVNERLASKETIMIAHHANIHTVAVKDVSREFSIGYLVEPHGTCIGGYESSGRIRAWEMGEKEGAVWGVIKEAVENADGVIAISNFIAATQIKPNFGEEVLKRTRVIYNQVSFDGIVEIDEGFIADQIKMGKLADKPYLLSIGILKGWKRPQDLVEASHALPEDVQTVFIGADAEGKAGELMSRGKNCVYLGPQYGPQRNALIRGAMGVTVASLDEPFGLTVVEANAMGIPVVARPAGAMQELVIDGQNGILAFDNSIDAYAKALRALVEGSYRFSPEALIMDAKCRFGSETTKQVVDLAEAIIGRSETAEGSIRL